MEVLRREEEREGRRLQKRPGPMGVGIGGERGLPKSTSRRGPSASKSSTCCSRKLLNTVIDACAEQGFRQMVAVIGDSENKASIELHRALGFSHVGTLPAIGFKFGRWLDSVMMQRTLGVGSSSLPDEGR